jgi:hypothetical protein
MGWWRNDNGDAVGDGPADSVSLALRELSSKLDHALRLGELLGAVEHVVNAKGADLLKDDDGGGLSLRAVLDVDGVETTVDAEPAISDIVRDAVDELCGTISNEYEEILGHRPTRSELVATFRFALAGGSDHIDVPDTARVIRLDYVRR